MSKQLLLDALKGETTLKAPWLPYAGTNCAFLINETAENYLKDPKLIAKGIVEAAEKYHADGIPLSFDLSMEAETLGCKLKWWQDNVPSVVTHPCSKETPKELNLQLPENGSGRWPILMEAAKIAKPQLDQLDCAMVGMVTGPLTLASHLAGVRIFTSMIKNKEFSHEILEFSGKVAAQAASFYVEMGCDVIAIVDPVASQIRPQTFTEFVTPNCQPAIEAIHKAGIVSSYFICGDCAKVIHEVCQLGTDSFAIDEQLNMNYIRDLALQYKKGFCGNLKLTLALSLGMLSPREDAMISLAAGGNQGFVLAPGCDIPFDTPLENLIQAYEAREHYIEYYPTYPEK
jgi:MtaA/CmuA family methyltransferase